MPLMKLRMTFDCFLSEASTITMPRSPGPRFSCQGLKIAKKTETSANVRLLPERRPQINQPSAAWVVGGADRPVHSR
jgi:hypothetical protein